MINIYEILKYCPIGTKLYCTLFGECSFLVVSNLYVYVDIKNDITRCFDKYGRLNPNGECVLFPSKEQRNWSKFKAPQPLPVKDELCWTKSAIGNWTPRYATGTTASNGMPLFFCNQSKKDESNTYVWRKWCDFEELIKQHK